MQFMLLYLKQLKKNRKLKFIPAKLSHCKVNINIHYLFTYDIKYMHIFST